MLILCYPRFIGQPIVYITWTANSILETQRHERVFNRGNLMSFVDNPYKHEYDSVNTFSYQVKIVHNNLCESQ